MSKDGGPAFPHEFDMGTGGNKRCGMSLRDYFAAAALAKIMEGDYSQWWGNDWKASAAYRIADAMLAEREK